MDVVCQTAQFAIRTAQFARTSGRSGPSFALPQRRRPQMAGMRDVRIRSILYLTFQCFTRQSVVRILHIVKDEENRRRNLRRWLVFPIIAVSSLAYLRLKLRSFIKLRR